MKLLFKSYLSRFQCRVSMSKLNMVSPRRPTYDKCLVLGTSEVRRLAECIEGALILDEKPNFGLDQVKVQFRTVSQLDIFDLYMVDEFKPQVVVLCFWGNDLSNPKPAGSPEVVGCSLVQLAEHLQEQFDVKRVVVPALNPRYFPLCGQDYPIDYNQRVSICNQYLLHTLMDLGFATLWHHPDILGWNRAKMFCPDGVHFSMPTGVRRWYRSLRVAIIQSVY